MNNKNSMVENAKAEEGRRICSVRDVRHHPDSHARSRQGRLSYSMVFV